MPNTYSKTLQMTKLEILALQARRARAKMRAERKQLIAACGCLGGLAAKHTLIHDQRGKNGRSMTPELLARHAAASDRILALA